MKRIRFSRFLDLAVATISLSAWLTLCHPSTSTAGVNPFETLPNLREYSQRAQAAVQSKSPVYFPVIQLAAVEQEAVFQYLRGELEKPLEICNLILLDNPRLRLLRNEIFARHGRVFTSPDLNAFFKQTQWYKPSSEFTEKSLTLTEQENAALIARIEYVHSHRHERLFKKLEFSLSGENKNSSLQVPEVNGRVSVYYDGCCGTAWGSTEIQDKTGKIKFSSSFGYDGGVGTMDYLRPYWGKNLIAWIVGELEVEPRMHDRIVILSNQGEPLVDVQLPAWELPADGYCCRDLNQLVLLSPAVMYINATEVSHGDIKTHDIEHLLFLKKNIPFEPK